LVFFTRLTTVILCDCWFVYSYLAVYLSLILVINNNNGGGVQQGELSAAGGEV